MGVQKKETEGNEYKNCTQREYTLEKYNGTLLLIIISSILCDYKAWNKGEIQSKPQ